MNPTFRMQKLPTEIIQYILKIKWFNARVNRLEDTLCLPRGWKKEVSYFGYFYYRSEIDFNEKRYIFQYRPEDYDYIKIIRIESDFNYHDGTADFKKLLFV